MARGGGGRHGGLGAQGDTNIHPHTEASASIPVTTSQQELAPAKLPLSVGISTGKSSSWSSQKTPPGPTGSPALGNFLPSSQLDVPAPEVRVSSGTPGWVGCGDRGCPGVVGGR